MKRTATSVSLRSDTMQREHFLYRDVLFDHVNLFPVHSATYVIDRMSF